MLTYENCVAMVGFWRWGFVYSVSTVNPAKPNFCPLHFQIKPTPSFPAPHRIQINGPLSCTCFCVIQTSNAESQVLPHYSSAPWLALATSGCLISFSTDSLSGCKCAQSHPTSRTWSNCLSWSVHDSLPLLNNPDHLLGFWRPAVVEQGPTCSDYILAQKYIREIQSNCSKYWDGMLSSCSSVSTVYFTC